MYTRVCIRTYVRLPYLSVPRLVLLLTSSSTAPLQAHTGQTQNVEAGHHGDDFSDHLRLEPPQSLHHRHSVRACVHLRLQTTVPDLVQGRQSLLQS